MTTTPYRDRAALARLADALIEDILATRDVELLAEAEADGDDGAERARTAFRRAVALSSRLSSRLAAKAGVRRRWGGNVRALDPKSARRWLEQFIADETDAGGIAAAARKVRKLSDEDVYGVLERLQAPTPPEQRNER
jgi:hypothetical protein